MIVSYADSAGMRNGVSGAKNHGIEARTDMAAKDGCILTHLGDRSNMPSKCQIAYMASDWDLLSFEVPSDS